jgi:ribonuclease-3
MRDFKELQKRLGLEFKNIDLLKQALVHRSYLNENPGFYLGHNERLEFLGDAVLELVVTEYLYNKYPNPEGELTNWRASLVNSKMLAKLAKKLNIEDCLYLSRGESKDKNTKARQYILANAFEAIVGAIYLDGGYKKAREFIERNLLPELPKILENKLYLDPKSRFQEKAQEHTGITPNYRVLSESGPDHNKKFKMAVFIGDELIASGTGSSKQEAEEKAAAAGLKKKGWS